jgi:hypothetical protein
MKAEIRLGRIFEIEIGLHDHLVLRHPASEGKSHLRGWAHFYHYCVGAKDGVFQFWTGTSGSALEMVAEEISESKRCVSAVSSPPQPRPPQLSGVAG